MNEPLSGRYRHYKGNEYTVLGIGRHSETHEELVVYRPEYGDQGFWVRPKAMFMETVKVDGKDEPRFQPLASSSEQVGDRITNIFDELPQHLPKELVQTLKRLVATAGKDVGRSLPAAAKQTRCCSSSIW